MSPNPPAPSESLETTPAVPKVARDQAVKDKVSKLKAIRADQIGLKFLYQPIEVEDTEIDVLVIHGIGAHPEHTWVDRESKVNWLKDSTMLPAALPNARIMTYGYDSYWFGDNATKQSLSGVAEKLLLAYVDARSECPDRPIIFVGHCFGGLVALQCYMTGRIHQAIWPSISDSVAGIAFLGTPFMGIHSNSGMATMGEVYRAIAESNVQMQDNVLNTIAQDNDLLVNAVTDFTRLLLSSSDSPKPKIFCFFEQKASHIGRVAGISDLEPKFLVTESSGTLNGHGKEGLPLDHFSMNKFISKDDNNYISVRRQILEMKKHAIVLMGARQSVSPTETQTARLSPTTKYPMQSRAGPILKEENFAKRGDIIKTIEKRLTKSPYVALYGDSGNGKTHIAVEYAHKFFQDTHGQVHWVNAGSVAEFELSYKHIAKRLGINRENMKGNDFLEAVYENLSQDPSGRWLMILDGWDDETRLKMTGTSRSKRSLLDYVPKTGLVRVLATTRSKTLAMRIVNRNPKFAIEVPQLEDADASLLLLGKNTTGSERQKAAARAKELGGSAGTLVLAHSYQKKASVAPKVYMERIHGFSSKEISKTMRAWRLLYDFMKEKDPNLAHLLLIMGAMDVQCIPNSFFERHELYEQIPLLVSYGMVEPSADRTVITVTPIIRECVQKCLDDGGKDREMIEEAVLFVMCDKFHGDEHRVVEVLLPCALAALKFKPTSTDNKLKVAELHSEVAKFYAHTKQDKLAAKYWERAISLYEKGSKKNHSLIQDAKEALKQVRARLESTGGDKTAIGKTDTLASQVAKKRAALLECERSAGQDHVDTIRKASEFATTQLMHGEKSEAQESIELYQRILEWCKTNQGDQSIDVARQQNNLALALEYRGEYDRAEKLYHSAIRIAGRQLGPGSPELMRMVANLASVYCKQGRLDDAEQAFRVTYQGQQKTLGADHPDTLVTRQNIAMILRDKGQVDIAVDELEQVLGVQFQLHGRNNPATLRTACSLAMSYVLQGFPDKAEDLLRGTLEIQKQVNGERHPDTAMTQLNLKELLEHRELLNHRSL
ncbi:hypothetical protein NUW58_g155 [Xylaria curta]|uniref:Uncharacterized protein n=1 Tax=Xylaria curta TaxID=42375 RepID=A0ACC1PQC0_9PEZI|nr:hypothetical protein NUW58_g155 [Xylaria curta]